MFKRILCAMLAGFSLLYISCGDTSVTEAETTKVQSESTIGDGIEFDRLDELGEKNFDGRVFTILDANDHPEMHVNLPGEELNGDIINDSLYERDLAIEDRYNIDIEYVQIVNAAAGTTAMKSSVLAGDDAYTICISTILGGTLGTLAVEGILANLNDLEYLSLDQNWWSYLMYDSLRFDDKMYYTTGDISPTMYQMPAVFYLNLDLAEDYGIDTDFCQLVRDGKWTLDVVINMTKDMNTDLNGDNVMHASDDFFGFIHQQLGGIVTNGLLTTAGVNLSTISDDGKSISVDIVNEKTLGVIEKLKQLIVDIQYVEQNDIITKAFVEDRALCMYHYAESASVFLRNMESDYLILPMPKADEQQEDYHSYVNAWADAFIGIPTTSDPEFAGFITEALDYYSYKYIRPLAYDLTYKEKASRDENSAEMLDIIFDTLYYDFNCIYNFGGTTDALTKALKGSGELASEFAAIQSKIEADVETFVENWNQISQ